MIARPSCYAGWPPPLAAGAGSSWHPPGLKAGPEVRQSRVYIAMIRTAPLKELWTEKNGNGYFDSRRHVIKT